MYLAHGNACTKFVPSTQGQEVTVAEVHSLACNHKEADTRLYLHAKFAYDEGARTVTICSPDTDVAVIALDAVWTLPLGTVLLFYTGINFAFWRLAMLL